ncbi:nucleolar protein 12 [Myxocyprinus asiaticus]|uniref:nucleolar protein 12 n=1 Tax=Myxocyprinus asiaticus TaxID=70543 RepID=UPI002223869C|nr:nucleolar protein 12 [Myxocyprinus asiaticus]
MVKNGQFKQKSKFKPSAKKKKCVLMFDDKDRQEFLTGFHKRKVERRKAALTEMKNKLKEEQKRVREERHKQYTKMLKERREALDEADELEDAITATSECVQYDHPNHTVTVTTISDLDLSGARLLEPERVQDAEDCEEDDDEEKVKALPKKSGNPILSKKIKSLTASLHLHTKRTKKSKKKHNGKREMRRQNGQGDRKSFTYDNKLRLGRTTKKERRRRTGRKRQSED